MATSSINPEKEEYKGWKAMATIKKKKTSSQDGGFPWGSVVKNPPANAGDTGSMPDLG